MIRPIVQHRANGSPKPSRLARSAVANSQVGGSGTTKLHGHPALRLQSCRVPWQQPVNDASKWGSVIVRWSRAERDVMRKRSYEVIPPHPATRPDCRASGSRPWFESGRCAQCPAYHLGRIMIRGNPAAIVPLLMELDA